MDVDIRWCSNKLYIVLIIHIYIANIHRIDIKIIATLPTENINAINETE